MAEITFTAAERRRGVAAATGCISIVGLMTGLALAAVVAAAGCPGRRQPADQLQLGDPGPGRRRRCAGGAPRLVGRFGLLNALYGCIATAIAALLLLPLFPNVYAWFPIRFALGAATSTIFIAGETWIIQVAPRETRGRIVGILGFAWSACFAAGPLIIGITGIGGWAPFLVAAAIVLLAALPLPLAQGGAPERDRSAASRSGACSGPARRPCWRSSCWPSSIG